MGIAAFTATAQRPVRMHRAAGQIAASAWPYLPGSVLAIRVDGFPVPYHVSLVGEGSVSDAGTYALNDAAKPGVATLVAGNALGIASHNVRIGAPPTADRDAIAVASYDDGLVFHDAGNFSVLGILAIAGAPGDAAFDARGRVAVADTQGDALTVAGLNPWNVTRVANVPLGDELAIDLRSSDIFVTNRDVGGSGGLTRVTPGGKVTTVQTGETAEGLAIDETRHLVYVANANDGTVAVVDSRSMRVVRRFGAVDRVFSLALSSDGKVLYAVSNQSTGSPFGAPGSVVAFAVGTNRPHEIARSPSLTFPIGIALDSKTQTLFVTDESADAVDVLNARTLRERGPPVATCRTPWKPFLDERTHRLYVPCARADRVDVLDATHAASRSRRTVSDGRLSARRHGMARDDGSESFLAKMKSFAYLFALLVALPIAAAAAELPSNVAPGAPFPRILEQAPTIESIAPGIEYGEYQLYTSAGPLSIHVVAMQPRRDDVHVASVLANNVLESRGETVGSMAKRTGAVAGINGDYFDIGNTNRPLNIVVRNGQLLQMPRKRYALAVRRDGNASIDEFGFLGQIELGDKTISLDSIDQVPAPNGGTAFLTPEFGSVPPLENTTLVGLQPIDGTPPLARYRVTSIADNLTAQPPGYYLAIGPGAYNAVDPPNVGDIAAITGDLSPVGLDQLTTAIGGGPLILHDGTWFEDPDGPNGGEFSKRIPSSGAAIAPDGTLFLIEVDGRQPSVSVGLTRREFAALMRGLGATEGLAFDGGGSSTMVVRLLGDADASVVNAPSDGRERPVGDGLLVYSTAPVGAAVRLVARPGVIRAVTGADVPLRIAAVDSGNHVASTQEPLDAKVEPVSLGIFRNGRFTALQPGTGNIVLHSGRLSGDVSIEVLRTPARMTIVPTDPNVDKGGTIALEARALDARGYHLSLPALLPWGTKEGYVDARGVYRAGAHDSTVTVRIGDGVAGTLVTVGSHESELPFADRAHFVTVPRGGNGSLVHDESCASCLALSYSFSSSERAAYAMADLPLPPHTIGLSFDVLDDGSASRLRVALRNAINEDVFLDAALLDTPGWRHVSVRWSGETAEVGRLLGIYVLPPRGMELSSGRIVLRNVRAVVAGQAAQAASGQGHRSAASNTRSHGVRGVRSTSARRRNGCRCAIR